MLKLLGFIHPKSGKEMNFTSILPQELEIYIKNAEKHWQINILK